MIKTLGRKTVREYYTAITEGYKWEEGIDRRQIKLKRVIKRKK